jgi:HD domain
VQDEQILERLAVVPTALLIDAVGAVRRRLQPAIFNHSVRVFVQASSAAEGQADRPPAETLLVASLFHDAGTADENDSGQRFEVEGADAAARFLGARDRPGPEIDAIWEAIALHTSPGIAERRGPLTRLLRLGVLRDFGAHHAVTPAIEQASALFPRMGIERVLAGAVVRQALRNPAKAPPATWPGGLLQAHLADPRRDGVNPAF